MTNLATNSDKLPPARGDGGRLLAGRVSLNPAGRPKQTLKKKLEAAELRKQDTDFEARVDYLLADGGTLPLDDMPQPMPVDDAEEPPRNADGTFTKGNTQGRLHTGKRSKGVTPSDVRQRIGNRIDKVIDVLFQQAEAGDTQASKLLLDRYLPSLKASEHRGIDVGALPLMIIQSNVIDAVAQDEADGIEDAVVTEHDVEPIGDKMPSTPE